jgi:hypothetical protein
LLKSSAMRVGMAIAAMRERNASVTRLVVRSRSVAFLAGHLGMQSGERISRTGMVELTDSNRLPLVKIVALQAIGTQALFVRILMTSRTGRRHSQKCAVEVFNLDVPSLAAWNVLLVMAFLAA